MELVKSYPILDQLTSSQIRSTPDFIAQKALVEEYLQWKESYSKSAHKSYRIWVERFQDFVGKAPEAIKLEDVNEFSKALQKQFASKSVQYGMNIIHNYLRFFHEQGRLTLPLYFIRVPRAVTNSHDALTEEEFLSMLQALERLKQLPLRDLCIIRLLHDTGMRVGELCSLTIGDINKDMSLVVETEKSFKKRRVFWTQETDIILRHYLSTRKKNSETSEPLFMAVSKNSLGNGITSRSVQRIIKQIVDLAGLSQRICPHSFRHGFIHRLAKKNVPDALIALLVGHTTPHTVAHYTKLSRSEIEDVYRRAFVAI